ncbi:ankyrin repeat-containing protein [Holotrichia oblita]|uniref:Ankyrin repeat-containing protein n=1 Tax=Holotrichia oblita TaxID=644536 RepID=A0ACB9TVY0_HOLOL|nr:ankyrin repeat-containing protein [Holotrichia oblita]
MGNKDITKMLIETIDLKKFGSGWLWDAIRFGDIEMAGLLLEAKADPNIERSELECISFVNEIHFRDALKAIRKCCDYNYDVSKMPLDESLSIADALGKTLQNHIPVSYLPLNTAIHSRRNDIVHLLLKNGVNINIKIICYDDAHTSDKEFSECTPLCCAVRSWNVDMVELLLQYGANVNFVESNGLTPLITAIRKEVEMYENDGYFYYTQMSDMFKKRLYNELRTDIVRVIGKLDWSVCKLAFSDRCLQIVEVLLRYGADVNFNLEGGLTPLDEALKRQNWMILEMLLLYGANPNNLNQWNFTDILIILPTENIKIIELLLKNGADPNFKTECYITPLYVAARRRHADMVKLLFEYGASADIITCTHTHWLKVKRTEKLMFLQCYLIWTKCTLLVQFTIQPIPSRF